MQPVRNLDLRTSLALARLRGTVTDRGDFLVVATPSDPAYYYGNMLVLPAPPQVGEVAYWTRRFGEELAAPAGGAIRHVTLWWDGVAGDAGAVDELAAAGFAIERSVAMTARLGEVVAGEPALPLRVLVPAEVVATAELAFAVADRHDEAHRAFLQRRATWKAELVTRGLAACYGAVAGDQIVSSVGIVDVGDGLARYQDVETAESYRRRGLASALLARAAREFHDDSATLVIVAAAGSDAERLYARCGFRTVHRTVSACRYPPA